MCFSVEVYADSKHTGCKALALLELGISSFPVIVSTCSADDQDTAVSVSMRVM